MNTPSYVQGASSTHLFGETINSHLRNIVEANPNNDALISAHQGYRATYAEFYEQVGRVAKGLIALGVQPGERVGIW